MESDRFLEMLKHLDPSFLKPQSPGLFGYICLYCLPFADSVRVGFLSLGIRGVLTNSLSKLQILDL